MVYVIRFYNNKKKTLLGYKNVLPSYYLDSMSLVSLKLLNKRDKKTYDRCGFFRKFPTAKRTTTEIQNTPESERDKRHTLSP